MEQIGDKFLKLLHQRYVAYHMERRNYPAVLHPLPAPAPKKICRLAKQDKPPPTIVTQWSMQTDTATTILTTPPNLSAWKYTTSSARWANLELTNPLQTAHESVILRPAAIATTHTQLSALRQGLSPFLSPSSLPPRCQQCNLRKAAIILNTTQDRDPIPLCRNCHITLITQQPRSSAQTYHCSLCGNSSTLNGYSSLQTTAQTQMNHLPYVTNAPRPGQSRAHLSCA